MNKRYKLFFIKYNHFFPPPISSYIAFRGSICNRVSLWQFVRFFLKRDKRIYWPVHPNSEINCPDKIYVGINTNAGTRPGCYIQGNGGVYLGNYVRFASNIGIISANHDVYDQNKHIGQGVHIGDYTWIGMGSIILPGVTLGPRTIVGAGSVVTKSFPDGFCIIAGNPAKLIKTLDKERFVPTKYRTEYFGFIAANKFSKFSKKHLKHNMYINSKLISD